MRRRTVIIALLAAALAAPALAQGGNCNAADARCAADAGRKQRQAYGAESIEDLATRGAQVIRAFFVDGYGEEAGLVNVVRGPASEPHIEWIGPAGTGKPQILPAGIMSLAAWEALQADGQWFDRALGPPPPGKDLPSPCMHGWTVRVETIDARGNIHRKVENACDAGLTVPYGLAIAKAAVAALPSCALLDPERTRNDVTRLAECGLLGGDRAAAAQALNAFHTTWFANPLGPDFARALRYLFYDRAELAWPGQPPVTGSEAASKVWTEQAARNRPLIVRAYGETPDRVRIEATVIGPPTTDPKAQRVPVTMLWTRENGFGFRLRCLVPAASPGH